MKGSKGYFCNFFCKSKIIFLKKEKIYKLNKIFKKITIQEKYNWTFGSIFTYDRGGPCWRPATIQPHDQTMSFEWSRIARPQCSAPVWKKSSKEQEIRIIHRDEQAAHSAQVPRKQRKPTSF